MNELDREFFEEYKKFFPGMNLEMISVFAQIMMALPLMTNGAIFRTDSKPTVSSPPMSQRSRDGKRLRLGLPKGSLQESTYKLFEKAG